MLPGIGRLCLPSDCAIFSFMSCILVSKHVHACLHFVGMCFVHCFSAVRDGETDAAMFSVKARFAFLHDMLLCSFMSRFLLSEIEGDMFWAWCFVLQNLGKPC